MKFMFSLLCEDSEDPLACQDNKCPVCRIEKLGEVAEGEDPDEGSSETEIRWGLRVPANATVSFGYYRRLTVVNKAGTDQKKRTFATEELTFETWVKQWVDQLKKDKPKLFDLWHQQQANYNITHTGKHCYKRSKTSATQEKDFASKRKLRTSRHQTLNESRLADPYSNEVHILKIPRSVKEDGTVTALDKQTFYFLTRDLTQDTSQASVNARQVVAMAQMKTKEKTNKDLTVLFTVSDQGPQYQSNFFSINSENVFLTSEDF